MASKRTTAQQQPEPAPAPAAPQRAGPHDFVTSTTGFPVRVDDGPAYPAAHPQPWQQRQPSGSNDYQASEGGPPVPAGEVQRAVLPRSTSN